MIESTTGQTGGPEATSHIDAEVQRELDEALGDKTVEQLMEEAATPEGLGDDPNAPPQSQGGGDPHEIHIQMVRGRIHSVRDQDVFVEIPGQSGKSQGVVPLMQFERPPRIGSIMDFVVQREDEKEGLLILSREGAVSRATWDMLQRGSIVEARVTGSNKGGLELELVGNIRAFMPASQIDLYHVDDLESFVGQKVQASVQEIDRKGKKVLLSRRHYLEREKKSKEEKLWKEIEVGQIREGVVTNVMDYGAFVDIGGTDGLLHVSDISYSRVDRPDEVLKKGQAVKVKVLKLDADKKRISLGLKQVEPDPWESAGAELKAGETVSGRVMRLADFGAFVEIKPGIEGLLPVSEISWKRINRPGDVLKEGEVLRVQILQVDPAKHRLSLSLKQAGGDPWVGAEHTYARGTVLEGTVLTTTDFGAFVELTTGVEGLVHISELSDRRVAQVTDVLKPGQKESFRVLEVDEENRRIRLSLKAVANPPAEAPAGEQRQASQGGRPQAHAYAAPPAAKKKKPSNLKGGMEHGALGMGLGDLRL